MKSFLFAAASVLALAGCGNEALVNTPIIASADTANRHAEIVNDTNISIKRLRVQNAATQRWSGNILYGSVRKNSRQTVLIDDGTGQCLYNFEITMDNGAKLARRGMDVCRLASWTIFRR